jgi:hypothetical protein
MEKFTQAEIDKIPSDFNLAMAAGYDPFPDATGIVNKPICIRCVYDPIVVSNKNYLKRVQTCGLCKIAQLKFDIVEDTLYIQSRLISIERKKAEIRKRTIEEPPIEEPQRIPFHKRRRVKQQPILKEEN